MRLDIQRLLKHSLRAMFWKITLRHVLMWACLGMLCKPSGRCGSAIASVCCGQGLSGILSRVKTVWGKAAKTRRAHKENDCKILRVKSGST